MVSMLVAFIKRYVIFVACGIVALAGIAAVSPRILDFIEFRFDIVLPYEAVVRMTLLVLYAAFLAGGVWWMITRGRRRHLLVWTVLVLSFIAFAVVAFFDHTHRLMEEFSWIRYTTTLFLLLASATAFLRWRRALWFMLGAGFFYAAADEVLELHEKLGQALGAVISLPPNATDYITVLYALGGIAVVLFLAKSAREWVNEAPFSVLVLLAGVTTYLLSTIFDTIDFYVLERLRDASTFFVAHTGSYVTDIMYTLWAPRNFLNGLEEVLEQVAAALFFVALLCALLEESSNRPWMDLPVVGTRVEKIKRGKKKILLFGIVIVFVVVAGGHPDIPLIPGAGAGETVIASAPQGLFHADDVAYHRAWGVIVANEGRGSLFQWKDNVWRQIPDPDHVIKNPDSVTADEKEIYVSDSAQGIIFGYREKEGWRALFKPEDGIVHPEALAVVDNALYVLDEGEKTISKIVSGVPAISWRPDHLHWVAPESIAYDEKQNKLYVSDDVSGALFLVDFDAQRLSEIAVLPRPEDMTVLPDGSLLVTDTQAGAIFRVETNGNYKKVFQFKRPLRDLQGIAYDGTQVLVISADGFGSSSFMPSFLWALPWTLK